MQIGGGDSLMKWLMKIINVEQLFILLIHCHANKKTHHLRGIYCNLKHS